MLSRLYIKNYALIEELEVSLASGFTVITGETGAGKSILIGALSLLGGKRADTSVLRNSEDKCIVEGVFILPKSLKYIFEKNDLDFLEENIFRREISAAGKSRAFINDTPVTLDILKEISSSCFDIHSQHEVFLLASPSFRIEVCDAFADIQNEVKEYTQDYKSYIKERKEFQKYIETAEQNATELDYKKFLFSELESFNYKLGEQDLLEEEQRILSNSEELLINLQTVNEAISNSDNTALNILQTAKSTLSKIASKHPKIEEQLERLQSLIIELKDVSSELEDIQSDIQPNPERLSEIESRLSDMYTLVKKHKLNNADELVTLFDSLSAWLFDYSNSEDQIDTWRGDLDKQENELRNRAVLISEKRSSGAKLFAEKVESILHDLAMPHAQFNGEVNCGEELNEYGIDEVYFRFTANKGTQAVEVHKSASGGEMSRVMLAIKSVIALKSSLPAIVFDEIDTGISGRVADMAGQIMRDLSKNCQVIAITHLPQIAAKGNSHFRVSKKVVNEYTQTQLHLLNKQERVEELASMLSGEELSEAALVNAKTLLGF